MAMTEPIAEDFFRAHPRGRRAGLRSIGAAVGKLADFLLPPVCVGCSARVDRHGLLCGACWGKIDFISAPFCDRLGTPLPYEIAAPGEAVLSAAAIADPPPYDRARAVAAYSHTMRELIQNLKYRDRHEGLDLFGRWLAAAGGELLAEADLLVPVPLHRSKLWSRRFNQSALLARRVSRHSGVPMASDALKRVKRTVQQVGLTADQRKRNVAGAFRVDDRRAKAMTGKRIVIIDDVVTTGATVEACTRALRKAGAKTVDVLALARAIDAGAVP